VREPRGSSTASPCGCSFARFIQRCSNVRTKRGFHLYGTGAAGPTMRTRVANRETIFIGVRINDSFCVPDISRTLTSSQSNISAIVEMEHAALSAVRDANASEMRLPTTLFSIHRPV
jgi:hypothetical protein